MLHQNTVSTLCLRIAVLHQLNNSSEKSQKIKSTDVSGAVHAVLQKRWKHTAAAYHVSHKSSVPYAPGTWDEIWHNQTCGFWARNICSNTCGRVVVQQQYTAVPVVRYVWSHISSIPGTDSSINRYKIDYDTYILARSTRMIPGLLLEWYSYCMYDGWCYISGINRCICLVRKMGGSSIIEPSSIRRNHVQPRIDYGRV